MKHRIRNCLALAISLSITTSSALAAAAPGEDGSPLLIILFMGFFALIIVMQLVPACLMFVSLLKGLFSAKTPEKEKNLT